ncbi:MAG: penicillin-binding transpeptidase domain-containing protein, partial [Bacteroidia bacterium]|nr:penicillin-binding transpeptidase domain-containing protein [Bacteroidia bacterium]
MISSARLQMGIDNEFGALLKKKNTRISDIKAMRGNIYADGERLLATTTSKYTLIIDAVADGLTDELFDKSIRSLSIKMAQHFEKRDTAEWVSYFEMLRATKRRYTILAKDINYGLAKVMRQWPIIKLGRYKGFYFEEHGERLYFMGEMARKAIGSRKGGVYVGLEGALDSLLSGINGKQMQQRMPGGVWRTIKTAKYNQPRDGYDIITTLDVQIQDVAQYALQKAVRSNKAQSGCAIVMDVKTGAVKAIANLKRGTDGKYRETKNYAVDDYSEPGSTVKLISAMALINDGYCKASDSIDIK